MRANKGYSKAFIEYLFMHRPIHCSHKCTPYKRESLCIHFVRDMLYNVDVRMLLSKTRQHKWVIEIAVDK